MYFSRFISQLILRQYRQMYNTGRGNVLPENNICGRLHLDMKHLFTVNSSYIMGLFLLYEWMPGQFVATRWYNILSSLSNRSYTSANRSVLTGFRVFLRAEILHVTHQLSPSTPVSDFLGFRTDFKQIFCIKCSEQANLYLSAWSQYSVQTKNWRHCAR